MIETEKDGGVMQGDNVISYTHNIRNSNSVLSINK
jgi:hypothetical protein